MLLKEIFGAGLFEHYNDVRIVGGKQVIGLPRRYLWQRLVNAAQKAPICVHGHFRASQKTSAADYYPKCGQFVVLLRDPLEVVISEYYYAIRSQAQGRAVKRQMPELNEFLENRNSAFFDHMPKKAKEEPKAFLEEDVIAAGCLERSEPLLFRLAGIFNVSERLSLPYTNISARHGSTLSEETIRAWRKGNADSIAFYERVWRDYCEGRARL
jgi:hypothetical protein